MNFLLSQDPQLLVAISCVVMILCLVIVFRLFPGGWKQTVGLPFGFLCVFAMGHVGMFLYLLPWYDPSKNAYLRATSVTMENTASGSILSAIALASFTLGVLWLRRCKTGRIAPPDFKLSNKMIVIGGLAIILAPLVRLIPSATPVGEAARIFLLAGICWGYIKACEIENMRRRTIYMAASFVIPISTIVGFGFAASGVSMLMLIWCCFLQRRDPRIRQIVIRYSPLLAVGLWLGLSFFVTYMEARVRIRRSVWGGDTLTQRVSTVFNEVTKFEVFDPFHSDHLHLLDTRLNQNSLIGQAVNHHRRMPIEFENGKTLGYAVVAWIPRIVWPDKPKTGGNKFVTKHTGRRFSRTTTVAAGHIFEFYVNFGVSGVAIGFFVLGLSIRWFDIQATHGLIQGDYAQLLRYHVLGFVMIQPSGMVFFLVTSMAGAVALTFVVIRSLRQTGEQLHAPQDPPPMLETMVRGEPSPTSAK